ncbi:AlwI family type II restriction endonuclease [Staphylococcus pseudintermedius]|nr:AlwI family type II restriction endonuclease [Staphylococcus pseudintermedius]EII2693391.1 AlwI family type II restriction endonuclease [Staphylococcus pseudintermedius]EII6263977.1 AlwI family type II restriction endonuclease [Staphylococcus pseudintermedius]ELJ5535748.1 AlwI family type II restriction endonuclease [Staphylococcus pseudintermedius]MDF0168496.1 AlwI family type II restriction endonuclease [Staphylococcus pseudintermedius]
MGKFQSRTLFFSTSPRNPELIPKYLKLIRNKGLEGKKYNKDLQIEFYEKISSANIAESSTGGKSKDKGFSGREKMTRAPQALGFLIPRNGKPLEITEAGNLLMDEELFEDIMLHQLLKFQLPSPLHKETIGANNNLFRIKPFLEIIRLIYVLEYLTYQELSLFAITLTDYRNFNDTVKKIKEYREERSNIKGSKSLKSFYTDFQTEIFSQVYEKQLNEKKFNIRENKEKNEKKFLKTKITNAKDYTDSIFRFLRATGLFVLTKGKSMSISSERMDEVKFILENIDREIVSPNIPLTEYFEYLKNPRVPILKNDNIEVIKQEIVSKGLSSNSKDIYELKKILNSYRVNKREEKLFEITQRLKLKNKNDIDDIIQTYLQIQNNEVPDRSAVMEWNTWRAAVMINNGDIVGNFIPDDNGYPISTAGGSKGDVVGDYGNFSILYEVTLSTGKKQYDMEGEPVPRHVGEYRKKTGKETFAFFIADKLNPESIYHFYLTTLIKSKIYDGHISVIPLNLSDFIKFFEMSIKKNLQPDDLKDLHNYSIKLSKESLINGKDEEYWYNGIKEYLLEKVS